MTSPWAGKNSHAQSLPFHVVLCFPQLCSHFSYHQGESERTVALFLEVFRVAGPDRPVDRLDHVPVSDPMSERSRFLYYWCPFLLYAALILCLSSYKLPPGPKQFSDKTIHLAEYVGFAFLLWRAITQDDTKRFTWKRAMVVAVAGALCGALDESYQSIVPGRDSSIRDWYADVAGILTFITISFVRARFTRNYVAQ